MLKKIAKSRKKLGRWKKSEKAQKQSKMREPEKYVQKTCFTAYFYSADLQTINLKTSKNRKIF